MLNAKGRNMESSDRASIQPFAFAPAIGAAFGLFLVLGSIAVSATSFQAFFSLGGLIIVAGGVVAEVRHERPSFVVDDHVVQVGAHE